MWFFSCVQRPGNKKISEITLEMLQDKTSAQTPRPNLQATGCSSHILHWIDQHTQHKINTKPPPSELWFHQTPFWYGSNVRATSCLWSYRSFTPEKAQRNICVSTPAAFKSLFFNTAQKFLICLWLLFSPLQVSPCSFLTLWAKSKAWKTVVFSCTEEEWRFVSLFGTGNSGFV